MDDHSVNFAVIEESFAAAESKDQLYAIFVASASGKLDSHVSVAKAANLPDVVRSLPAALGISNEKALVLMVSLHNLLKRYMATSMADETVLAAVFPENFKKSVKSFLFKAMREVAPLAKTFSQDQFASTQILRDFDWRLDLKVQSRQQERMKQPNLLVKLELDGGNARGNGQTQEDVMFQMSKGQLSTIIENFEVINQQLSGLAETMQG